MTKHDKPTQGAKNNKGKKPPDDDIHLEVATPNGVYRGVFPKTTKVKEVIVTIVEDRDLEDGDSFQLFFGEIVLEPVERPLVSFGLPANVLLTLVATGSGV
ncbi:hypothetical protein GGD81_004775 [Rhodobium orientis]|uniref:Uncharacterized protein n=1 Tax=Rhodobium orientis TaxID=34017 RepID=A0A327JDW1_9HYPH|nr:hypothetical protein [Rhodobium orientis]MBB4305693.1 hypothetical protein [Rhodobium orientis]MBK5948416.1 hypothetical protein [Rhodobium orientis]RAI24610.1 hypothetical protein CH339_21965 [Rhodobium orientis]